MQSYVLCHHPDPHFWHAIQQYTLVCQNSSTLPLDKEGQVAYKTRQNELLILNLLPILDTYVLIFKLVQRTGVSNFIKLLLRSYNNKHAFCKQCHSHPYQYPVKYHIATSWFLRRFVLDFVLREC